MGPGNWLPLRHVVALVNGTDPEPEPEAIQLDPNVPGAGLSAAAVEAVWPTVGISAAAALSEFGLGDETTAREAMTAGNMTTAVGDSPSLPCRL
jgi:hypothetical protein